MLTFQEHLTHSLTDRWFYLLVAAGLLLNATGLYPPILEPDGALYASIAKTMALNGDFVNLFAIGRDWLDKPHFPFWITAFSYLVLGVNTLAYKLPALVFFGLSTAYTYRFTRLMYPKPVAQVATLVFLTAFHGILSNSDVRAEPYLTALVIGPVYHFYRVYQNAPKPWLHIVLGSFLTGCALMTKGPFVVVPIGAGLVLHWLLTGHWRELLKPRWYSVVILSALFTLPEIISLYRQFDLHPDKVVFGKTDVSGVRFFFWDSQFGRFFNTGPIKGSGDPFFFVHTLLWAFLPWSLPLYVGVGTVLLKLARRHNPLPEYVSLGSGLATFLLFSASGFQLPHYMNIVFPFFAILTAQFLVSLSPASLRRWTLGQTVIGGLLVALIVAVLLLFQPGQLGGALTWVAVVALATTLLFRGHDLLALMGRMTGVMLLLAGVLNLFFYPSLLQYQAGMVAAEYVNTRPDLPPTTAIYGSGTYGESAWSYEFYVDRPVWYARPDSVLRQRVRREPVLVFTSAAYADSLRDRGFAPRTVATFPYYHVSKLSYPFLNPATRPQTLRPYVLLEVKN
ncbi:glycosyl transferase [Fibrisoma montanum]|uniref:Glycosyl transferase n=1 Tax=Fibrisoma montanum TaxID=2305895 RepID=A0A418M4P6_9BACT|nr:glycosyltransferase family 39 protein [Fibrisoma montanum]RIV20785.1 glycosyl transferase [Fibrisoma montanum]